MNFSDTAAIITSFFSTLIPIILWLLSYFLTFKKEKTKESIDKIADLIKENKAHLIKEEEFYNELLLSFNQLIKILSNYEKHSSL